MVIANTYPALCIDATIEGPVWVVRPGVVRSGHKTYNHEVGLRGKLG